MIEVQEISQGEHKAEIKTRLGYSLKSVTSPKTLEQNLRRAEMLQKFHWSGEQTRDHSLLRQELLGLIMQVLEK